MPKYLILPSNVVCTVSPKLRLAYRDLDEWEKLQLLAVLADALTEFILLNPFPPVADIADAEAALLDGRVPSAEVPRLGVTLEEPSLYSVRSLIDALVNLGYERFPVLATEPAAKWHIKTVDAVPMPPDWSLVA